MSKKREITVKIINAPSEKIICDFYCTLFRCIEDRYGRDFLEAVFAYIDSDEYKKENE